jgi:hypothetical protein
MGMQMQVLTQVWSTARKPMEAPKSLGSAAVSSNVWAAARNRML